MFAVVMVAPPVALLVAWGVSEMVVLPVRFLLNELGLTLMVLWLTSPKPNAWGLDHTEALPPLVELQVLDHALAFALPLDASSAVPVVALAVAAPPEVSEVVIELALAGEPLTMPIPAALMPALTVVSPTAAPLV